MRNCKQYSTPQSTASFTKALHSCLQFDNLLRFKSCIFVCSKYTPYSFLSWTVICTHSKPLSALCATKMYATNTVFVPCFTSLRQPFHAHSSSCQFCNASLYISRSSIACSKCIFKLLHAVRSDSDLMRSSSS